MPANRYAYAILDVFTQHRFGGNPLAVIMDARGLSSEQMQQIAREFGFSETTFVLPTSEPSQFREVRIFTPARELPFAGHPNIGTAFALALDIEGADPEAVRALGNIVFEEKAGLVPISLRFGAQGPEYAELRAPEAFEAIDSFSADDVAQALHLPNTAIRTARHQPTIASVGLPFLFVEVSDLRALGNAFTTEERSRALFDSRDATGIFIYCLDSETGDNAIRARMFAPRTGVPEDPATGSACGALAGLLASIDSKPDLQQELSIAQGVEMGRPSLIHTRALKSAGKVDAVYVGGSSVLFATGFLQAS